MTTVTDQAVVAGDLVLGDAVFPPGRPLLMAVVNRTPDSFYDRGATFSLTAAVEAAERAFDAGADIVDVGGVPAGRGPEVSVAEECDRVVPVIEGVRRRRPGALLSVDTWRAAVAREALAAGAVLVNDPWEGHDGDLPGVVAAADAALVCTHSGHLPPRSDPEVSRAGDDRDVVADVLATVTRLARRALDAGVRPDGIVVDPGHDLGKTTLQSLELSRRLDEVVAAGWPVLVALSRKDFIGEALDVPVEQRLPGTVAAAALAAWLGARAFRVHDVRELRQALDLVAAIRGDLAPRALRRGLG